MVVLPSKTLLLNGSRVRLGFNIVGRGGTVGLAESVATSDQGNSFLVVHGHAAESCADVPSRGDGVRNTIGTLRVDVDQTHVRGRQRVLEIALVNVLGLHLGLVAVHHTVLCQTGLAVGVANVVAQPSGLSTPVYGLIGLPLVRAATSETEGLDSHVLESNCKAVSIIDSMLMKMWKFPLTIASEEDQVSPRDLVAVLLLDRPQQAASLVDGDVVGPAVEWSEALLATAAKS